MVRPTGQEVIGTERVVCYSQIPREGVMMCHTEPYKKVPEVIRREEVRERHEQETLLCSLWGMKEQGMAGKLRICQCE